MRGAVGAIVAAAMLLHSAAAIARDRPCPPIIFGKAHESLDRAAVATLRALLIENHRFESGGFVIEKNGAFRASKPVTQRSRSSVNYCIVVPRGARLAGLYHTHVANPAFSPRDRNNADRAGVPSYIATIRDGGMFVYDARVRQARALGEGSRSDRVVAAASPASGAQPAERAAAVTGRALALFARAADTLGTWGRAARRALFAEED
jgi:proteasome lid subunit RPN8/RPN11